ncbi:MAG: hypothetical protein WBD20_22090 [Pirellulaceae bacterium]
MIHYTCDRCKRNIDTTCQTRYIVKIEIQTAHDDCSADFEDDVDHLSELHQILEGLSDEEMMDAQEETCHTGDYDLCPECHKNYLKNPLGRDAVLALGFSNN